MRVPVKEEKAAVAVIRAANISTRTMVRLGFGCCYGVVSVLNCLVLKAKCICQLKTLAALMPPDVWAAFRLLAALLGAYFLLFMASAPPRVLTLSDLVTQIDPSDKM